MQWSGVAVFGVAMDGAEVVRRGECAVPTRRWVGGLGMEGRMGVGGMVGGGGWRKRRSRCAGDGRRLNGEVDTRRSGERGGERGGGPLDGRALSKGAELRC